MLHESGHCSSPNYKITSGSRSLIKDPSLPAPAPCVSCCIKTPTVNVRPLMLKAAQRCSHTNINYENLGWMEIQVTPSEFRHIKATVCLSELSLSAVRSEYIRLMKERWRLCSKRQDLNAEIISIKLHWTPECTVTNSRESFRNVHSFRLDRNKATPQLFSLQDWLNSITIKHWFIHLVIIYNKVPFVDVSKHG